MTTSTSLNLLALFKSAVLRSGMDTPARAASGLTPPAKALYAAAAAQAIPRGAVLYVVPTDRDLEQTVADVAFFLGALEGLAPEAQRTLCQQQDFGQAIEHDPLGFHLLEDLEDAPRGFAELKIRRI